MIEKPSTSSAITQVSDSSSEEEPLAVIQKQIKPPENKQYMDYIRQRNESLKKNEDNEALEQIKAEKKQLEERLKKNQETLAKERKERAMQIDAEEKEKHELERRERER